MEVNINNIRAPRYFERRSLPDGSARLTKYKVNTPDAAPKELLELAKNPSWQGATYILRVNLPPPSGTRELEAVIVVVKSSPNCYKLTYSDFEKSELSAFKNYDEINKYLRALDVVPAAPTASAATQGAEQGRVRR